MKTIFKFTIIALGVAAIALSVIVIANRCKNALCDCIDDEDFDFDLED